MPDAADARLVAKALRDSKEMRAIASSLEALEVRRDSSTAAELAALERQRVILQDRARTLAATLPSRDILVGLLHTLDDATNTEDFGGVVDSGVPVLLLPIRLQTRFVAMQNGTFELQIRFLPDTVAVHSHEPELTPEERDLGAAYWASVAADANTKLAAWTVLVTAALGPERAAWITLSTDPAGDPDEQALERLQAWTRAPAVDVLPEHFTVRGYRGGAQIFEQTTTALVPPSLEVGADPNVPGANAADATTIDDLLGGLPPQLDWLTDFTKAENRGMAIRIPMSAADANAGFDRLVVLGVRTAADAEYGALLVEELFDGHHYTEGLAIAPRGAPTNNTEDVGSWYHSSPPPAQSLAFEREDPLFDLTDAADLELDGPRLSRALGIAPETFEHVRGADGSDQRDAGFMASALWPATWGYYLKQVLADTISAGSIVKLRRHFVDHVRGRGPLPPIRTGQNPYGVLPVMSLARRANAPWNDRERNVPPWLPRLLQTLEWDWLQMSASSPRVGHTGDAARDLYELMTMQATAATFASSAVYGEEFTGWSSGFFDMFGGAWGDVFSFLSAPQSALLQLMRRLGLNESQRPRLSTFISDAPVPVQGLAPVHSQVGPQPLPGTPNYLAWLAMASVDDIRAERNVPAGAKSTMLYRVLRHSVLSAYVETAKTIKLEAGALPAIQQFEAELVAMPGVEQVSSYAHLESSFTPPGGGGQVRIGDYLSRVDRPYVSRQVEALPVWLEEFLELRSALLALSQLSTERLQLLFTETLDCCSHRLDAWITSLATQRLDDVRRARPEGLYVGAYGWVENLQPRTGPAGGGYLLAPSSSHATAAAMLRSGYLSRDGAARGTLAVELSSHRVKQALWMFDSIRAGNSLAAVLGYRFERLLHDTPVALGLEQYLPALRDAFPMDPGELTEPDGPSEAIGARDVVNGLALHKQWLAFAPLAAADATVNLFMNTDLPAAGSVAGTTILGLLSQLDESYDAMADIALSESVFQVGRGQYERAGAVAAAMAGQRQMPEIEVTMTPRTGTTIRNKVFLSLDPPAPNALAGWGANRTPRAAASPEMNQWLAAALGDPAEMRVQVRYRDANAERRAWVQLSSLGVDAIDLVAMFAGGDSARDSELEQRIRYWLTDQDDTRRDIEISFDSPPPWAGAPARPANTRTVSEVAELLRTLQRLVGTARAAIPSDLVAPDQASAAALTDVDLARLVARAKGALDGMWNAYTVLLPALIDAREAEQQRLARNVAAAAAGNPPAAGDEGPDGTVLDAMRAACFALSWYGVSGTVIPDRPDPLAADLAGRQGEWSSVVERAVAALREAEKRFVAALAVAAPADVDQGAVDDALAALEALGSTAAAIEASINRCTAVLKGVFGKSFVVPQPFALQVAHPLRAAHTDASPNALGGATPAELARWLFEVSQAHLTLTELELATLMSAAQTTRGSFGVSASQLPFAAGDRWVALERPGVAFPPGLLSTVFVGGVHFSNANNERFAGLVLAEWEEVVPNKTELAALAYQFDQPASEPPQALLLAVPSVAPQKDARWTRSELFDALTDTLSLARVRTVDPDLLKAYGLVLPALYFTQNFANDAPSTTFQIVIPNMTVAMTTSVSTPTAPTEIT